MSHGILVDDHVQFRESASALLEADGFAVVGKAADGATALLQVKRLRPDVVLLDVQLPTWTASRSPHASQPLRARLTWCSSRAASWRDLRPPVHARSRVRLHLQGRALRRRARRPRRLSRSQWLRLLLWPTGVAIGLLAGVATLGWSAPRSWIPDLLTGWTLLGCGLVAWSRRPESRSGLLLVAAGFAWFVPNLGAETWGWLATSGLYLHPGRALSPRLDVPLGTDSRPAGSCRCRHRVDRGGGGAGVAEPDLDDRRRCRAGGLRLRALRGLVRGGAAVPESRGSGGDRPGRGDRGYCPRYALRWRRLRDRKRRFSIRGGTVRPRARAVSRLAPAPRRRFDLTDLIIDLAGYRSPVLRDELTRALGDPTLAVGFSIPSRTNTSTQPGALSSLRWKGT